MSDTLDAPPEWVIIHDSVVRYADIIRIKRSIHERGVVFTAYMRNGDEIGVRKNNMIEDKGWALMQLIYLQAESTNRAAHREYEDIITSE